MIFSRHVTEIHGVVVNTLVTLPLAIPPVVCIKILGQDKSSTIGSDLNFEIWPHSHTIHRHTAPPRQLVGDHVYHNTDLKFSRQSLEMVQTLSLSKEIMPVTMGKATQRS